MSEQTPQDAYVESCLIDLSKQLTAAEKRIETLEKALQFYECGCKQDSCTPEKPKFRNIRCGWIARAALEEKKDGSS